MSRRQGMVLRNWLFAVWLMLAGCVHHREPFTLTARLRRAETNDALLHLAIVLRNVSNKPLAIVNLTNLFEGNVYLRNPLGEVHEFTQSNCFLLQMSAQLARPSVELAPGASLRFEHALG